MLQEELAEILESHRKWLYDEEGGGRADLRGAVLSGAVLSRADLSRADLSSANLSRAVVNGANLSSANLSGAVVNGANLSSAVLSGADLSSANLSSAVLSSANLSGADLSRADLDETSLDPELHSHLRRFVKECPPLATGGRIVYRTVVSQHVGSTEYVPGQTYVAPHLSMDVATACHPGIYAASLSWMDENFRNAPLVACYVRDGDWTITAKGAIRCKRLRVIAQVI